MANRWESNHYNNDDGDDINNLVLTKAEFLDFRKEAHDENQQFCKKSQQIIGEIKQMIATLLARKSYLNNDQYIQQHTPNYKKIPFFDGDMCELEMKPEWSFWIFYFSFWNFFGNAPTLIGQKWYLKRIFFPLF